MQRTLIVDAQIFQTPAWHRGMGKYSMELLAELCKLQDKSDWKSIHLILSSDIGLGDDVISEIHKKLPKVTIVSLDLKRNNLRSSHKIALHNRKVINEYVNSIEENIDTIDFFILSLMQGEISPVFPSQPEVRKFLLFYDLVPLTFFNTYLKDSINKSEYLPKIIEIFKADAYFSISKTVANNLSTYLGIDKKRIYNIDGGPIEHSSIVKPINVPDNFILMPTGNDPRKNNRRGILAFNDFSKLHQGEYSLVVTSFFTDREKEELSQLADNVIFTGNVSGEELNFLYKNCKGLLFPAEYEGLGLPILEAVANNKPITCSNISVFREMSKTAFRFFEPTSVLDMSRALEYIVSDPAIDLKVYKDILDKYRWSNTVQAIIEASGKLFKEVHTLEKRRLSIIGANPTSNSSAGKFMQYCHGEMSRHNEIKYFFPRPNGSKVTRLDYLSYVSDREHISSGLEWNYDDSQSVFYISNSKDCAEALFMALAVPGLVILQDVGLESAWNHLKESNLIGQDRYNLELDIQKQCNIPGLSMVASLVNIQKHIIVFEKEHEKLLIKLVNQIGSKARVHLMDLPLNSLVYSKVLPQKTTSVGEMQNHQLIGDGLAIKTETDFQYDYALSKMKTLVVGNEYTAYEVMESVQVGVVPFLNNSSKSCTDYTIKYNSIDQARDMAKDMIQDKVEYSHFTNKLAESIKNMTIDNYVDKLNQILDKP